MNGTRTGSRIPLELPVRIRWESPAGERHVLDAVTRNISGNGMLIDASIRLREGTSFTFTVSLPSDVTRVPVELDGSARVVRQNGANSSGGVGAIIDDYQIRRARMSV